MTDSAYTVEPYVDRVSIWEHPIFSGFGYIPSDSIINIFGGETGEFIKVTEMGDDYIKFVHMGQQELFIG